MFSKLLNKILSSDSAKQLQKHEEHYSHIASYCQGKAKTLSYNDGPEGVLKHNLVEISHLLDSDAIRVHSKKDGLLMLNARGKSRYMTWREIIAFWLLRGKLEIRP